MILEQGSADWKSWRNKGIGSSDIATVLGINPYKTIKELWLEKTGQVTPPDISNKYAVKRGVIMEPIARDLFNANTDSQFTPATFIYEEHDFMRYSSDGVDFEKNEIIEIKCMGEKNHTLVKDTKQVISYYRHQCLWGLLITKAKLCHFISYNPSFPEPMEVVVVEPDETEFKLMIEKAIWFWDCVTNMKEPI